MNDSTHVPARGSHRGLLAGLLIAAVVIGGLLATALAAGVLFLGARSHHEVGHFDHTAPVPVEAR